jgi:hypothetical protein
MPPLLLPGLEPASPGTPTVLTRIRCLSLKPDMDREVRSHPDSRISAKVQSWELGLGRVMRHDETILNSDMSVAYITDCATSPVNGVVTWSLTYHERPSILISPQKFSMRGGTEDFKSLKVNVFTVYKSILVFNKEMIARMQASSF